jgi:hypothetical protein
LPRNCLAAPLKVLSPPNMAPEWQTETLLPILSVSVPRP